MDKVQLLKLKIESVKVSQSTSLNIELRGSSIEKFSTAKIGVGGKEITPCSIELDVELVPNQETIKLVVFDMGSGVTYEKDIATTDVISKSCKLFPNKRDNKVASKDSSSSSKDNKIPIEVMFSVELAERFQAEIMFETGLDYIANAEKPWYFKGEDLYLTAKKAVESIKETTPTVDVTATKAAEIVDKATESVIKRFTSMTIEENFSAIKILDDALTHGLKYTDDTVDSSRAALVKSISSLKEAIMIHTERLIRSGKSAIEQLIDRFDSIKQMATNKINTVKADVSTKAAEYYSTAAEHVSTVQSDLGVRANAVIDTVKAKAIDADPLVKKAITVSHPYVQQAFVVTQPLIAQAIDAAGPYVTPYLEKAHATVQANPVAAQVLATTTDVFNGAKAYYEDVISTDDATLEHADVTDTCIEGSVGELGQD